MAVTLEQQWNKHMNHDIAITWTPFKNRDFPVPTLFCKQCNKQIQYLNEQLAWDLIDNHHIPQVPYTKRKKVK